MRYALSMLAGVLVAASLFAAGMVVSTWQDRDVAAQGDAAWSMIVSQYRCDECYAEWPTEASLDDLAERGDPEGDMSLAINVIAKLAQDGCEWQWQILTDGVATVILYRC